MREPSIMGNHFLEIDKNTRKIQTGGLLPNSSIKSSDKTFDKLSLPKSVQKQMNRRTVKAANANVTMAPPTFYHPLFEPTNMMLPRDRRERNEWCRHFYRTEPIIATAIDMHTEFPISDFNIMCADPKISEFFNYMLFDKINIHDLLLSIGLEYWKIGDVFPYGVLNENEGIWDKFVCYNPDFINITSSPLISDPIIELIPTAEMKQIIDSGPGGEYGYLYNQLDPNMVSQVKRGQNITMDNKVISHIAHSASPYDEWGTPIMMRCFKTLIYKDKLRSAQQAIADRHIMPLRVAKIGAQGEPYPTQEDIDSFRDMLYEADGDPSFFLVYHYGLQFEYVGSSGHILPLNTEFDFIQKEIMNGLGINEAMLNGEGPTYANAEVGLHTLAQRYMSYRLRLENWIRFKVLKPISEIQGFYKSKNGEISASIMTDKQKKISASKGDMDLIVPQVKWQQEDLTSDQNIINIMQTLQDKGLVSVKTFLPMVGLDPEIEANNLEAEKKSIFNPEYDPSQEPEEPEVVDTRIEEIPVDSVTTTPVEVQDNPAITEHL